MHTYWITNLRTNRTHRVEANGKREAFAKVVHVADRYIIDNYDYLIDPDGGMYDSVIARIEREDDANGNMLWASYYINE